MENCKKVSTVQYQEMHQWRHGPKGLHSFRMLKPKGQEHGLEEIIVHRMATQVQTKR